MSEVKNLNKEQLLLAAYRARYKKSFYAFFKDAVKILEPTTQWDFNWHVEYICNILQSEIERVKDRRPRVRDIVLNISPRSSKSYITTVIFPVYCWLIFPECVIMSISHTEKLAKRHSHQSKILIESDWFKRLFPEIEIRDDTDAKGEYANTRLGRRMAYGMTGGILGSGADIVICDDLNDPHNVSEVMIDNVNLIYKEIIYGRVNDPNTALRLIIQQRVHEKDISATLLKQHPDQYYGISIPAEITKDIHPPELIQYYTDGLYWASRFNRKVLQQYKAQYGDRGYAAQYLQNPVPAEGGILKKEWFERRTTVSEIGQKNIQWFMFIDSSYTDKTANDPTGIIICGLDENDLVVRYAEQKWMEFPNLIQNIRSLNNLFKTHLIYVEPKATGKSIVQSLRKEGFNIVELDPTTESKLTRVNSVSATIEAKRVVLVTDHQWNDLFLDECTSFPFGAHDDMLDCLTYAINKLMMNQRNPIYFTF